MHVRIRRSAPKNTINTGLMQQRSKVNFFFLFPFFFFLANAIPHAGLWSGGRGGVVVPVCIAKAKNGWAYIGQDQEIRYTTVCHDGL